MSPIKADAIDILRYQAVDAKQFAHELNSIVFMMNWNVKNKLSISFVFQNKRTGMLVEYDKKFSDFDTEGLQGYACNDEGDVRILVYPKDFNVEVKEKECEVQREVKRRIISASDATPRIVDIEKLLALISQKKVLFYTGAGISASLVSTMHLLEDELAITAHSDPFEALRHWVLTPEKSIECMDRFFHACFDGPPSQAHYALAQLGLYFNHALITENIDTLHQKAGAKAANISDMNLSLLDIDQLRQIDAVVCIGLSADQSGFLELYKEANPQGILVGINREIPHYLSKDDWFMQGDIQLILPAIVQMAAS